ncbi:MAG: FAD-binding protein [Dehalococcoidia bacterium]|nr:FAD-binding protein [Dehalococcoidia bacterium]MDW8119715.1 FAD-linked oxidase C-terminal domain-containing protein [Chloroflexota bacterium]
MHSRAALASALRRIVGQRYVLDTPEALLVYEYDGSVDRSVPGLVVLPGSAEETAQVVRTVREAGWALVPRGAGTGLSGGAVPLQGAVVLSLARLNRILEIDPDNMLAVVEPGVANLDISKAVQAYGLYYAPDPSSQKACTIGGNVAENAGGPHCLAYGVTTNHVLGMEAVLADGSLVWVGGKHRHSVGYDLRGVVIGSEGMLVVVTKVVVRLLPLPEAVKTLLAVFTEIDQASAAVSAIIASGMVPAALEMLDRLTIEAVEPAVHAGYPKQAGAVLLVEVEGLREAVAEQGAQVEAICREMGAVEVRSADRPEERERLWAGRKGALGALGRLAPNYLLLDGVVPRTRIVEALQRIRAIAEFYRLPIANVFHAGDGNLHPCILFDERDPDQLRRAKEAGGAILKMCVEMGGALSGEHGVGIEKQEYMPLYFTQEDMAAMAKLLHAFGSAGFLNPGKVFPQGKPPGDFRPRTRLPADAVV